MIQKRNYMFHIETILIVFETPEIVFGRIVFFLIFVKRTYL